MTVDWGELIVGQLEFYWDVHLRPRLHGLTDEEYLWEPVPGAWSLRRQPDGHWAMDGQVRPPQPPPVTTIAWRMMHIAATGLLNRASAFFGEDPFPGADMNDPRREPADLPGTAAGGLAFLDLAYRTWHDNIAALDPAALTAKLGPKGGFFADDTMAALVIHQNREIMHHGGELGLLRDLYRAGLRA